MLKTKLLSIILALAFATNAYAETHKIWGRGAVNYDRMSRIDLTIKNGKLVKIKGVKVRVKNPVVHSISASRIHFTADFYSETCPSNKIVIKWNFKGSGSYQMVKNCRWGIKERGKLDNNGII